MIRRPRVFAALAFASVLAGCGGAGATMTGHVCPAIGISIPGALVNPADGSTGVSPSVGTLSFTLANTPASFVGASVSLAFDPNQRPTFSTPATLSGGVYTVGVPPLQQHTKYTATVGITQVSGGCTSGTSSLLGSFTTQ